MCRNSFNLCFLDKIYRKNDTGMYFRKHDEFRIKPVNGLKTIQKHFSTAYQPCGNYKCIFSTQLKDSIFGSKYLKIAILALFEAEISKICKNPSNLYCFKEIQRNNDLELSFRKVTDFGQNSEKFDFRLFIEKILENSKTSFLSQILVR